MSLRIYMDEHIPSAITARLRARGVDVLTTQDDNAEGTPDDALLDRASLIERAIYTNDEDFLEITAARLHAGIPFFCVFYAKQSVSRNLLYAEWLETHALLSEPDDVRGRLIFIP